MKISESGLPGANNPIQLTPMFSTEAKVDFKDSAFSNQFGGPPSLEEVRAQAEAQLPAGNKLVGDPDFSYPPKVTFEPLGLLAK